MKLLPFEENVSLDNVGSVILHYGKTASGKSTSCFATLPGIIVCLCMERRDAHRSALAANRSSKDYRLGIYDNFEELLEFANDFEKRVKEAWGLSLSDIGSVMVDGISQLMINLSLEMSSQIYEKNKDDKGAKSLIAETKMTPEAYGSLARQMVRAVDSFAKLAQQHGKIIVMNALLEEQHNKWDDTYSAEPKFEGNMFGKLYAGMCDLIGLVDPRYKREISKDNNGQEIVISRPIFPPRVKYEKEEWENFTCKWSGKRLISPKNPNALIQPLLDFNTILGLQRDTGENDEELIIEPENTEPKKTRKAKAKTEPKTEPMAVEENVEQKNTETEIPDVETDSNGQEKISWA